MSGVGSLGLSCCLTWRRQRVAVKSVGPKVPVLPEVLELTQLSELVSFRKSLLQ